VNRTLFIHDGQLFICAQLGLRLRIFVQYCPRIWCDASNGLPRDAPARERMARQAAWFAAHRDDRLVA
jgi:hypothetical protein